MLLVCDLRVVQERVYIPLSMVDFKQRLSVQRFLDHGKLLAMVFELDASVKPPIQGRFGSYAYGLLIGE